MKRRLTAGVMAVLTATGIGVVATAESASAAPGYIGPKTCYMKTQFGYSTASRMQVTAWPYNGGRRYHFAFWEDTNPAGGTNWSEAYIYVTGVGWVKKAGSSSSDSMPTERYVNMPTNITHAVNAKWTHFLGGIPSGWSYCYGDRPVL